MQTRLLQSGSIVVDSLIKIRLSNPKCMKYMMESKLQHSAKTFSLKMMFIEYARSILLHKNKRNVE